MKKLSLDTAREIRTERAVRRISSALMFFVVVVLAFVCLTQYMKFKPQTGEDITDGKLKQFLDNAYANPARIKLLVISLLAALSCFLPRRAAIVSTFAATVSALYLVHLYSSASLSLYPNGFLMIYLAFFGISLWCAASRHAVSVREGRLLPYHSLSTLAVAVYGFVAFLSATIVRVGEEYEYYIKFTDMSAEDFVEKDFGEFEPFLKQIGSATDGAYEKLAIVSFFVLLMIAVLYRFRKLAALVGTGYTVYVIYIIHKPYFIAMALLLMFCALTANACLLVGAGEYTLSRNNADGYGEDDEEREDDEEYESARKSLEEKGLDMEDFG